MRAVGKVVKSVVGSRGIQKGLNLETREPVQLCLQYPDSLSTVTALAHQLVQLKTFKFVEEGTLCWPLGEVLLRTERGDG